MSDLQPFEADAERYRFWRRAYVADPPDTDLLLALSGAWTAEEVDAILDKARGAE